MNPGISALSFVLLQGVFRRPGGLIYVFLLLSCGIRLLMFQPCLERILICLIRSLIYYTSELGVGAMLSQILKGMEHPVLFISRKLLPHEKNYATVEKECLAIKWAVEKLRYYLLGRKFILVTDNAPLKWKSQNKGKNARINQWFLRLQDFQFTVEHRAGNSHVNADAMSRRLDCCGTYARSRSLELGRGVWGDQEEVLSPTKQPGHLQHHGELHQRK